MKRVTLLGRRCNVPPTTSSSANLNCNVMVPQNYLSPLTASPQHSTIISIALTDDPSEPLPVAPANVTRGWEEWLPVTQFLGSDQNLVQDCHAVSALVKVRRRRGRARRVAAWRASRGRRSKLSLRTRKPFGCQ